MAQAVGADLWNMDQTKANNLCHVADNGATVSLAAIQNNIVLVNKEGKRFVKESDSSINAKSYAELEQTDHEVYAIFDSTMMDSNAMLRGYNDLGYFLGGDTLEELADKMDVDKDAFLETMKNYHQYCVDGKDPEFDTAMTDTLEDAPFYAVLVTPSMQSTYGGVHTDENARVLSTEGNIIPGLYAAGAVSGHGCFGNEVGNGLTIASTFGMIAAASALEDIQ
jgi:fumarate reductase flavoprotein subunit